MFAGHEFFVDQEANYIYPRTEVNKKGSLPGQPTWAKDRTLGAKFSYPGHQLPRSVVVEITNSVAEDREDEITVEANRGPANSGPANRGTGQSRTGQSRRPLRPR